MGALDDFAEALRSVEAPESLYPLAARARAMLASATYPGPLLVAHSVLLLTAQRAERDPLSPEDFDAACSICSRLADLIDVRDMAALDALGAAWRAWTRPDPLH